MPQALVVDDEPLTVRYLSRMLAEEGFAVSTAGTLKDARRRLREQPPDVLLLDLVLPDGAGLDLIKDVLPRSQLEVAVITGHASIDSAVEALKLGASDYLTKPIDATRLMAILNNTLRIRRLQEQIGDLHERLRRLGNFGSLLGASAPMRQLYDQIAKVAPTGATVLISGESGSGKELVARTIHDCSTRREGPYLALNCGGTSPNLIESELFGHEEGSFTGATSRHIGHFERAQNGTLFLDEVAEMPPALQVKLLRVLETRTFSRIGGGTEVQVDVRVVAATNRSPEEAVAGGRLRQDLFYRLNVFSINVPPLRERKGDIDLLAGHFLAALNRAEGTAKSQSTEVMKSLRGYRWPGNVRELKNVVQRAFILSGDEVLPEHLPRELREDHNGSVDGTVQVEVGTPLAEIERRVILATLNHCGGNKKKTAAVLGINLRTLYNRLKGYGPTAAKSSEGVETPH